MFTYICIAIALILYNLTSNQYKSISLILLLEFLFHKITYTVGIQMTSMLELSSIYLAYTIVNTVAIFYLIKSKSHIAIIILILANLTYNVATISQYYYYSYDFYSMYATFVGTIMLLQLLYMVFITDHVQRLLHNDSCNIDNASHFCGWFDYRRLL